MSYIEKLAEAIFNEAHRNRQMEAGERELYLIYAVLALTVGDEVTRENVHNAWSAWKAAEDPSHKSLKPYWELLPDVRAEDELYVQAIRKVARALRKTA